MTIETSSYLGDTVAFKQALGLVVSRHRMSERLSIRKFALMVGMSHTHLCRIECGKSATSVTMAMRIAEALDLNPGDLLAEAYEEALCFKRARQAACAHQRQNAR